MRPLLSQLFGRQVVLLILFLGLLSFGSAQTYSPIGWYTFNTGSHLTDVSGSGANLFSTTARPWMPGITDTIVGQYYFTDTALSGPAINALIAPAASFSMDTVNLSAELLMKPGRLYNGGTLLEMWAPTSGWYFFIDDTEIEVFVRFYDSTVMRHEIPLTGVGRQDASYYTDGNWHHLAFTFSSKTGQCKVYVDGVCPPGFSMVLGPSKKIAPEGNFTVGSRFPTNFQFGRQWFHGCLDEIALYDTILSPEAVYQHYEDAVLNGKHYTMSIDPDTIIVPMPGPALDGERNALEFAPGYPSVPLSSLQLLQDYPGPRYHPKNSLPEIRPWFGDFHRIVSDPPSRADERGVMQELVDHYHYLLLLDRATHPATSPADVASTTTRIGNMVDLANTSPYDQYPRMAITNWSTANHDEIGIDHDGAYINDDRLPSVHYAHEALIPGVPLRNPNNLTDTLWSPRAPVDSLILDGRAILQKLKYVSNGLLDSRIHVVSENGEVIPQFGKNPFERDSTIKAEHDALAASLTLPEAWPQYMAHKYTPHRHAYLNTFLDTLEVLTGLRPEMVYYDVGGTATARLLYDTARVINTLTPDGYRRPTPYFYPQFPHRWRYHFGALSGVGRLTRGRFEEMKTGVEDSIFQPFVSPGFDAGDEAYRLKDDQTIRPGQYLGLLKNIAMQGADTYNNFMFNSPVVNEHEANWRIWKTVIPSYAQGITSRIEEYMYDGKVMEGDLRASADGSGTADGTRYSFNTGNPLDFITARKKNGADTYVISGSAQKSGFSTSNGDLGRDVGIVLGGDSLHFNIRLQGSTYIYDNLDPGEPVFYQLDTWHEWKEPSHWCKDFCFEGEVYDSLRFNAPLISGTFVTKIRTEVPGTLTDRDFTDFTSWLDWGISPSPPTGIESAAGPPGDVHYGFLARDTTDLHFWIRARLDTASGLSTGAWLELTGPGYSETDTLERITSPDWQWYRLDSLGTPIVFPSVLAGNYYDLIVSPKNTALEIDRIILKTGNEDINVFPLTADFASDTVCYGDTVNFASSSTVGSGCVDYFWDFGDGTRSHEANPSHYYQYPDTYNVSLIVTENCSNQSDTTYGTIMVHAPIVEAGRDTVKCGVDTLRLDGATNAATWAWAASPSIEHSDSLNSRVFNPTTETFYLTGSSTFTFGGMPHTCSLTDSAVVFVADADLGPDTTYTICKGDTAFLSVNGGLEIHWIADPTLQDTTPDRSDPWAFPDSTTTYFAWAVDVCLCDTDTVAITVLVREPLGQILTPDTTICGGDTIQLFTNSAVLDTGGTVWYPAYNMSTFPDPLNPTVSPDTGFTYYAILADTFGCVITDSVVIDTKSPWLYIINPDTVLCETRVLQLETNGGLTWDWSPGTEVNDSTIQNPTTLPYRDTELYSVTITDTAGCTWYDEVEVLFDPSCCVMSSVPDTVFERDSISHYLAAKGYTASDTVFFMDFQVLDTLVIDTNVVFHTCDFFVDSGGVVLVNPDDTLFVIGDSRFLSACEDYMWEGVILEETTSMIWSEGTRFLHAFGAVQSFNGANYYLDLNDFTNDSIGVWVHPYAGHHPGLIRETLFRTRTAGSDVLVAPLSSTAIGKALYGVYVQNVDSITVGDSTLNNYRNTFRNLDVGVYAESSNIGIYNNRFTEILPRTSPDGEVINGYAIDLNGVIGDVSSAPNNYTIGGVDTVARNRLVDSYYGAEITGQYSGDFINNRFVRCTLGVNLTQGIVTENNFDDNRFVDSDVGIAFAGNSSVKGLIENNRFINETGFNTTGVRISGESVFPFPPAGFVPGMVIRDNVTRVSGTGVLLNEALGARVETNTIRLIEPFGFSYDSYGIKVDGSEDVKLIDNNVKADTSARLPNTIGININQSVRTLASCNVMRYFEECLAVTGNCDNSQFWENRFRDSDLGWTMRVNTVLGDQGSPGQPTRNRWSLPDSNWVNMMTSFNNGDTIEMYFRNTTYNRLTTPPANYVNLGGTGVDLFNTGGSLTFSCTDTLIGPGGGGSTTLASAFTSAIANGTATYPVYPVEAEFQGEQYLFDELVASPALVSSAPAYTACYDTLGTNDIGAICRTKSEIGARELTLASAYNSSITGTNLVAANYKFCNDAYIRCLDTAITLDIATISALRSLANGCPYRDGHAVYQARTIMAMVNPLERFKNDCPETNQTPQTPESSTHDEDEITERVVLYPNPTRDVLYLDGISREVRIEVYDYFGRKVVDTRLDAFEKGQKVNVSNWTSGVYFMKVIEKDEVLQTDKLIIQ